MATTNAVTRKRPNVVASGIVSTGVYFSEEVFSIRIKARAPITGLWHLFPYYPKLSDSSKSPTPNFYTHNERAKRKVIRLTKLNLKLFNFCIVKVIIVSITRRLLLSLSPYHP